MIRLLSDRATIALLTCLITTVLPAQERDNKSLFQRLDANGDGVVEASEVGEDRQTYFDRLVRSADANSDGKLSLKEFQSGLQSRELRPVSGQPSAGSRPERRFPEPSQLIQRFDRNGDGRLALSEFPEPMQSRVKMAIERLGVETLGVEELKQMFQMSRNQGGEGRPGNGAPGVRPPGQQPGREELANRGPGLFRLIDEDGDGRVTQQEWSRLQGLFERLDRNSDGALDPRELGAAMAAGQRMRDAGDRPSDADAPRKRAAGDRPGNPRTKPEGARRSGANDATGRGAAILKRFDKNEDGRLAGDELSDLPARMVQILDQDQDGVITRQELQNSRLRR